MDYIYFQDCETLEQASAKFRDLSKKYHPDICDEDPRIFQEISDEYRTFRTYFEVKSKLEKHKPQKKAKTKPTVSKKQLDTAINSIANTGTEFIKIGLEIFSNRFLNVR